jgi:hypothetical protein
MTNEGQRKSPQKRIIFFIIRYLAPLAVAAILIAGLIN